MGFETPPVPAPHAEKKKDTDKLGRLARAAAGAAALSVGMMAAGHSTEAQAQEQREQMEQIASGVLSHSKEVFEIGVKKGSAKAPVAGQGEPSLRDYACEDITVKIGGEVFTCQSRRAAHFRGIAPARGEISVEREGREIRFTFIKPVSQETFKQFGTNQLEVLTDAQGNPVFQQYSDTKYEAVSGLKARTPLEGVFRLDGVQLKGVLEQYQ